MNLNNLTRSVYPFWLRKFSAAKRLVNKLHGNFLGAAIMGILMALSIVAPSRAAAVLTAPSGPCLKPSGECFASGKKFHPGHYLLVFRWKNFSQSQLNSTRDDPFVLGAQVAYQWKDLEPKKGVYDFSKIESDLNYLKSFGKRLVIQVLDRSFGTKDPYHIIPAYLIDDPIFKGGVVKNNTGYVPRLWDPIVMDREIALFQALASRFDNEPFVEAVNTSETSPSFAWKDGAYIAPPDFSPSALAKQLKRMQVASAGAFRRTIFIQYVNFLGREIPGIVDNVYRTGSGTGSPDVIPGRPLESAKLFTQYANKLPLGSAVQPPELCGKEGCHLPKELLEYGVNTLKLNYMFWTHKGTQHDTATAKYSWKYGIVPTIRAYKGAINRTCPANLGVCDTN